MAILQRVVKPTTHKGKKVLLSREPKIIEDPKRTIFLHGRKSSETVTHAMKDLLKLKKPHAVMMSKKNDIVPFEDTTKMEFLAKKQDSSLFFFTSHTKKRPNNIVIGQCYDKRVLDMFEMELTAFKSLAEFKNDKIAFGTKPYLIFAGPEWEQTTELQRLKTLFVDMFNREYVENVSLQGLEHALSFIVTPDSKILLRSYRISFKKSGSSTPRVELDEIGPALDLKIRRSKLASDELYKVSLKKPKALKKLARKNLSTNKLGTKLARVHVGKQQIKRLQTRKMKGLRKGGKKVTKKTKT